MTAVVSGQLSVVSCQWSLVIRHSEPHGFARHLPVPNLPVNKAVTRILFGVAK
jgi:hypothetical protein